ncbi:MAG: hypothetical protein P9M12_01645 [Candidatus Aceula lacicola]|nr:hypothetical protein [Candidatus Aceula lacicola]
MTKQENNKNIIYPHESSFYRDALLKYFGFLKNGQKILDNVSYHFQYLEFLYKVKEDTTEPEPNATTRYLLNLTIIQELFMVFESFSYCLLIKNGIINKNVLLSTEELFKNLKKNKIFEDKVIKYIEKFKDVYLKLSQIHKFNKQQYDLCNDSKLEIFEKLFEDLMKYIIKNYSLETYKNDFPWPWK